MCQAQPTVKDAEDQTDPTLTGVASMEDIFALNEKMTARMKERDSVRAGTRMHTEDEDAEYNAKLQELDERILKLINTFLKKLESSSFLDLYSTR